MIIPMVQKKPILQFEDYFYDVETRENKELQV